MLYESMKTRVLTCMHSEGYSTWSVCVSLSLSVCVSTLISTLRITKQMVSDVNGYNVTSA